MREFVVQFPNCILANYGTLICMAMMQAVGTLTAKLCAVAVGMLSLAPLQSGCKTKTRAKAEETLAAKAPLKTTEPNQLHALKKTAADVSSLPRCTKPATASPKIKAKRPRSSSKPAQVALRRRRPQASRYASLFLLSQSLGSQSSTLLPSGSISQRNLPFSWDSGPLKMATPASRSCLTMSSMLSMR